MYNQVPDGWVQNSDDLESECSNPDLPDATREDECGVCLGDGFSFVPTGHDFGTEYTGPILPLENNPGGMVMGPPTGGCSDIYSIYFGTCLNMDCAGVCFNGDNVPDNTPYGAFIDSCGCCVGGNTNSSSACISSVGNNSGELYIANQYSEFDASIHLNNGHLVANWGMDDCGYCFPTEIQNNQIFEFSECNADGFCVESGVVTEIQCLNLSDDYADNLYGNTCINVGEQLQSSCTHELGELGEPQVWDCAGIDGSNGSLTLRRFSIKFS